MVRRADSEAVGRARSRLIWLNDIYIYPIPMSFNCPVIGNYDINNFDFL